MNQISKRSETSRMAVPCSVSVSDKIIDYAEAERSGISAVPQATLAVVILKQTNFDRRKSMAHTVFCVKLKRELPGLDEPPFDNELGRKVYDNVSQEAWRMWTEHCKMLLNEYRLNPARREDQEVIVRQLDQYFFGEGSAPPKEYVPPSQH
jgi:Fe-S cluster biosynthesis and repair protein YggX